MQLALKNLIILFSPFFCYISLIDDHFIDEKELLMKISLVPASTLDNQIIQDGITDYNIEVIPSLPRAVTHKLDFALKNEHNELIGGINAEYVNWGILSISLLFIEEKYRSLGYGTKLLSHIEHIAKEKGCYLAHTDTFEFQAKDFYLSHGYEIFGILDNCPKEYKRYYLKKDLGN